MRLWGIVRKNHKIAAQSVAQTTPVSEWNEGTLNAAIDTLCRDLDLSRPVVLYKHTQEMSKFGRTIFARNDFIEPVSFDAFEVEWIDEVRKKEKNNDFSEF